MKFKLPKLDYAKIAADKGGQAVMLFGLEKLKTIKFVADQKPLMKGLIYTAIGIFGPALLGKNGNNPFVSGAAKVLDIAGTSQLMAGALPNQAGKFANIGDDNYTLSGTGMDMDEDSDDGEGMGNADGGPSETIMM